MPRTGDIHIDPKLVRSAAARPEMLELRSAVKRRFGVSDERARSFAERVLSDAVERFGVEYLDRMTTHIERAFELREQAANIIEQVIGPEAMSPDAAATRLEGLFREIKGNVESITGPEAFAKSQTDKALEDIAFPGEKDLTPEGFAREKELKSEKVPRKALRSGRHTERLDLLARRFKRLAKDEHAAMGRAAEFAPHELWRAISSEIGPAKQGLQGGSLDSRIAALLQRARDEGMSPKEMAALEKAVRALNEERRQQLPRDPKKLAPRAARDVGSGLTKQQSEFLDRLLEDAAERGFETPNIDELHKALNRTDEVGRWELLRSWRRDVQSRALHAGETRRGGFFPDEHQPGFASDEGLDRIENESMVTREGAERVGALAGRDFAERTLKLRDANWINPFEGRRSRFGTGFDDVMVDSQGNYWIVEYKGGKARLARDQMQNSWVLRKLEQYEAEGGELYTTEWAGQLRTALREGRLRGVALETKIVGRTAQATTVIGRWKYRSR